MRTPFCANQVHDSAKYRIEAWLRNEHERYMPRRVSTLDGWWLELRFFDRSVDLGRMLDRVFRGRTLCLHA